MMMIELGVRGWTALETSTQLAMTPHVPMAASPRATKRREAKRLDIGPP
jgi:hypothetical protein